MGVNRYEDEATAVPDDDPLMPAVTGAPPPADGVPAENRARYEAAVDDVELLRTHLRLIGDAVGTAGAAPSRGTYVGPRRAWRRPRLILALAAVVAAVGVGAAALVREAAQGDSSTAKLTDSGIAACSRVIVEGTVERAVRGPGGTAWIVLDVDRFLKPRSGPARFSFTVTAAEAASYREGATMLVVLSHFREDGVITFEGDDLDSGRARMETAVAESRSLPCPGRG